MFELNNLFVATGAMVILSIVFWAMKNYDELKLDLEWGKDKKSLKAEGKKHSLPEENQNGRYSEE